MASRDTETLLYWSHGFPVTGLNKTGNDTGTLDFWSHGFPLNTLVPAAGGGSSIKTVEGLAIASVKTIDGLAIASVKTLEGLSNV